MLEIQNLNVHYSKAHVLRDIHLRVEPGEFVSIIGPNGAGKTTLFRAISGLKADYAGTIRFKGALLSRDPAQIVRAGLIHCPEGRHLFPFLSVEDNLQLGAFRHAKRGQTLQAELQGVYELFPVLGQRAHQIARTLSGGEQQMLAIGRALMGRPELLLLDEPTVGLAPIVRQVIVEALKLVSQSDVAILLAEQNVPFALEHAHRVYLLETGSLVKTGTAEELRRDEHVRQSYLGVA
jgi:branched-chain amino acid transport system ATP-binding protein